MSILEGFFTSILNLLNISGGFNLRVVLAVLILAIVGEGYIQIPLLMESIWLLVGYQAALSASPTAVSNLILIFIIAQIGRQTGIGVVYRLANALRNPISRFLNKRFQNNKFYRKYVNCDYLDQFNLVSIPSATLGMMTPLNGPIKILLVMKREPKVLFISTLLSGMAFDSLYIILGAVFRTTSLSLTYLPLFLLVGFFSFIFVRIRLKRAAGKSVVNCKKPESANNNHDAMGNIT